MKHCKLLLILIFCLKLAVCQNAFSTKESTPPSPNVASLFRFSEIPVSLNTGVPDVGVPIYTIKGKQTELPITLQYHAGGVRVTDVASWVGTGWTLNAGGVITQAIRGNRDDRPKGRFNLVPSGVVSDVNNPTGCELKTVLEKESDVEPDIFSFSFSGKSGQFFLDKDKKVIQLHEQKIKIEYIATSNPFQITSWIITDLEGVKYYFEETEQVVTWSKPTRNGVLLSPGEIGDHPDVEQFSWMLKKIEQPNAEVIVFNYESYTSTDYVLESETKDFHNGPLTVNCYPLPDYGYVIKNYKMQTILQGKRLQSIVFPGGRVEFLTGQKRCDLYGDRFLERIAIYNSTLKIKEFVLNYKYFVGNTAYTTLELDCSSSAGPDMGYNPYKDRRLFLASIYEADINNVKGGTYVFEYENSIGLPSRHSAQQDWWGYYNGNGYNSLLQNVQPSGQFFDGIPRQDVFGRGPNLNYAKQGTLKKVTYPTGGSTEFDFELNSSPSPFPLGKTYIVHPEQNYTCDGQNPDQIIGSFTVNNVSGNATISFKVDKCVFGPNMISGVGFYVKDEGGAIYISSTQVNNDLLSSGENRQVSYLFNNGTYTLYSYLPGSIPCSYLLKVLEWREQLAVPDNSDWGGLRIGKISNYDPVSAKSIYKTYEYVKSVNGKALSTGYSSVPLDAFRNEYIVRKGFCLYGMADGSLPDGEESDVFLMLMSNANYAGSINYTYVKERSADISNNDIGYSVFEYEQQQDYIIRSTPSIVMRTWMSGHDMYPWPPSYSYSWARSLPKKIEHFVNKGGVYKPVKSTQLNYSNLFVKEITPAFVSAFTLKSTYPIGSSCPSTSMSIPTYEGYRYNTYSLWSSYKFLDSEVTEETDANNNVLTTTKTYEYSQQNFLPSKITTNNSNASSNVKIVKYPCDYSDISSSDNVSAGIKSLASAYVLSKPIEIVLQRINSGLTKTVSAEFYSFHANNLQPAIAFGLESNTGLSNFTISTVQNGAVTKDTRYSDRVLFNLYDTKYNLLEQQKAYDIKETYLWGYAGQYPIAKVVGSSYAAVSSVITQAQIDAAVSDDASLRTLLNNLRTDARTKQAFTTTYTYKPLVGITSETDLNGRITYYEYDAFNRLDKIKDHNNNILKKYCYNYAGQQVNCSDASYTNTHSYSGEYQKNDCAAGYTGSTVTFTVPSGSVTSNISEIDANANAQAKVLAEGQAYANANGTCSQTVIYARMEYINGWSSGYCNYGDVVIRFYSDATCTTRVNVNNLSIGYEMIANSDGGGSCNYGYTNYAILDGTGAAVDELYLEYSALLDDFSNFYYSCNYQYVLVAGSGYTITY
ncbi:MAG TPA: DUF5977 domain-containing protein [Phnomibacter sp.]|nr:DUF5977 domain-containing protein [Phnomibacter sp.]